jgi:hypothetical protein
VATSLDTACSKCGRERSAHERVCALCGSLLRIDSADPSATAVSTPAAAPNAFERVETALAEREQRERHVARHTPWLYFGLGLVTAPIFAWTPLLQYMGWFLASLVHEMGHAALAWICGMPAVPAISPAGHAAAVHGEQSVGLALLVLGGALFAASTFLEGRARVVAMIAVAVVQPVLAFTPAKDLAFLLAGHAGELSFATLALWKALDGGFTSSKLERALYGTVGWYLAGKNVLLCVGLMSDASARAHYASNGSFGLTNDYIRAAEDVLGWRLESVALLMLVASLATVPAAILAWRASASSRRAEHGSTS